MASKTYLYIFVTLLLISISQQRLSVRVESKGAKGSGSQVINDGYRSSLQPQSSNKNASRMHIVIAHYNKDNIKQTVDLWTKMLSIEKISAVEPSVFVYCQNPLIEDLSAFEPLLKWGGTIKHVENLGRESHAFLLHILQHYHDLPDSTLFSQDLPEEDLMEKRIERLLVPETGFLPLALVATEPCFTEWLTGGLIAQLYSWLRKAFCPPEGIAISFMGQFVVSRARLRSIDLATYQYLLDMLRAPRSHWIHGIHGIQHLKSPKNPMFGHVMERSWAMAFNCAEHWRAIECKDCDDSESCDTSTCQCLDSKPEAALPRRGTLTDQETGRAIFSRSQRSVKTDSD